MFVTVLKKLLGLMIFAAILVALYYLGEHFQNRAWVVLDDQRRPGDVLYSGLALFGFFIFALVPGWFLGLASISLVFDYLIRERVADEQAEKRQAIIYAGALTNALNMAAHKAGKDYKPGDVLEHSEWIRTRHKKGISEREIQRLLAERLALQYLGTDPTVRDGESTRATAGTACEPRD